MTAMENINGEQPETGNEPWNREYPNWEHSGGSGTNVGGAGARSLLVQILTGCGFSLLLIFGIIFSLAAVCFSIIR